MYIWWHRKTNTLSRTNSNHYFGFNYPEYEAVYARGKYEWLHPAMAFTLAIRGISLNDWIASIPLVSHIHECNGVCGAS